MVQRNEAAPGPAVRCPLLASMPLFHGAARSVFRAFVDFVLIFNELVPFKCQAILLPSLQVRDSIRGICEYLLPAESDLIIVHRARDYS